jgi:hypothetical protein
MNSVIFLISSSVSMARCRMWVLITSHWVLVNAELGGVLWQRWQFSLHNWLPLLSVTLVDTQLVIINVVVSIMATVMIIVLRFIKNNFRVIKNQLQPAGKMRYYLFVIGMLL